MFGRAHFQIIKIITKLDCIFLFNKKSVEQEIKTNCFRILEHKTGIDLTVSSTLKKPSKNYTCFILRRFGLFLIHLQSKIKFDASCRLAVLICKIFFASFACNGLWIASRCWPRLVVVIMALRRFCFNILWITFGPAFAFSDFDVAGCLGFAFDVFCFTALSFLASQSPMVMNCWHCQVLLYFFTENGLRIIRNVSK